MVDTELTTHLLMESATPEDAGVDIHGEPPPLSASRYPVQGFVRIAYKLHRYGGLRAATVHRVMLFGLILCSWLWFHALFVGIRWRTLLTCSPTESVPCHCDPDAIDCWWKGWLRPILSGESAAVALALAAILMSGAYVTHSASELVDLGRVQRATNEELWIGARWDPQVINVIKDSLTSVDGRRWGPRDVSSTLTRFEDVYDQLIRTHRLVDICTGKSAAERYVFCHFFLPHLFDDETRCFTNYQFGEYHRKLRRRWHLIGALIVLMTPLTVGACIGWIIVKMARDIYKCHVSPQHTSVFMTRVLPASMKCRYRRLRESPHAFDDRCTLIMRTVAKLNQHCPANSFVVLRKALRFGLGAIMGAAIVLIAWDERIAMLDILGHRLLIWVAIAGAVLNTLRWNKDHAPIDMDHRDAERVRRDLLRVVGIYAMDTTNLANECDKIMNQMTYGGVLMLHEMYAVIVVVPQLFLWKVPNRIANILTSTEYITSYCTPCGEVVATSEEDDPVLETEEEKGLSTCESSSLIIDETLIPC